MYLYTDRENTVSDSATAHDMNLIRLITPEGRRYALQKRMEPSNRSQEWWQCTNWYPIEVIEVGLDVA